MPEYFQDLVNEVCAKLPDDWQIVIGLERDAGTVDLFDPDGERVEFPTNYETLQDQVEDALEHALAVAGRVKETA